MIKKVVKRMFNRLGYDIRKNANYEFQSENKFVTVSEHGVLDISKSENMSIEYLAKTVGSDIVHYMARTGEGTDECMDKCCLPVLAHFYQPIPDLKDLESRDVWNKVSEMRGIDWNPDQYLENLRELAVYADECEWSYVKVDSTIQFYLNNPSFGYFDASVLHCMIRKNNPQRIIEVGSGMSSRIIAAALQKNIIENNSYKPEYIIIDPYSVIDVDKFPRGTRLVKQQVETCDISVFQELSKQDILFIDSSHVCKIGSDVNFEVLEILPILKHGVYVHFHDICLPYEYPKKFATNPEFRMFWTEQYLLQAFLLNNSNFEIILPTTYIGRNHKASEFFPNFDTSKANWGGASFWIKRVEGETNK